MKNLTRKARNKGQTALEYALVIGVIVVGAIMMGQHFFGKDGAAKDVFGSAIKNAQQTLEPSN